MRFNSTARFFSALLLTIILGSGFPVFLAAQQTLNLDFERLSAEGTARPWGWQVYSYAPAVISECDTTVAAKGQQSLKIYGSQSGDTSLYEIVFAVEPNQLLHQVVDLRAHAKTSAFAGTAGIKLETVGRVGEEFGVLSQREIPIRPSADWQTYQLSNFDLGDQLHTLLITLYFRGSGTVWFDQLELLIDGRVRSSVPVAPPFSVLERATIEAQTTPFRTTDPAKSTDLKNVDFFDLEPFKTMVGDAQIIALGEATHGTSEFFRVKHRLLQYAIRELGVRVFVLEDNQLYVERINEYVLYGKGKAEDVISGLFSVWNTTEMLNMIEWIRSYNLDHPTATVEFVGMDVQNPTLALEHLDAFLLQHAPQLQQQAKFLLADFSAEWRNSYFKTETELLSWQQQVETVYQLVTQAQGKWMEKAKSQADRTAVIWAVQNAHLLRQCVASMLTGVFEGRDQSMAENVEWIRAQRPEGTRLLIWAHDTHVSRGEAEIPEHNYYYGASMGAILAKTQGENYRAFGLYTYTGTCLGTISYRNFTKVPFEIYTSPDGSLDAELHQLAVKLGQPNLLLNLSTNSSWLHRLLPVRYVGYVAEDYGFNGRYIIPHQFDGVLFIDETKAAQPLD